jgi:hypothetical protein
MKNLFTSGVLFFGLIFMSQAQPTTITWQGKLLDAGGNAITQNNVAMTFAMFDASTAGSQLWPETGVVTKTVNIINGLYSVQLGTGIADDIAFTTAMFNGKTPWLEVKVGTETLPRTEITNVPFSLISNDLSASGWENPGEIGKTTPNAGKFTSVETESLKVTTGASDGKVLTSDIDGNASWETLTPDDIGAASSTHSHYNATASAAGFMSAADKTKLNEYPSGTATGQMLYWDGSSWLCIPPGLSGQVLLFSGSNIPGWTTVGLPKITTSSATSITSTSVTSGGIINEFGETVISRGVCWDTLQGPTVALSTKTSDGSGAGVFSSSITGLYPNTKYYVRAYLKTNSETYYGDQLTFITSISVGDNYKGGVVFYILQPADFGYSSDTIHGLIAATTDQSAGTFWGCRGTYIDGTSVNNGTGAANTALIIGSCPDVGTAAYICDSLTLNGFSDWYLPSLGDYYEMCVNRTLIPGFSGNYWTSSQFSTNSGWGRSIPSCGAFYQSKNNLYKVRAIRSF